MSEVEAAVEPNTNVDVDATDVKSPTNPHKVWPLFLVGVALMGLGYYFVFAGGAGGVDLESDPVNAAPTADGFARVPDDLTPIDGPMSFELSHAPRTLSYDLAQSTMRSSAEETTALETRIVVDVKDEPVENEALAYDRTYDQVDVDISQDGAALEGNIPEQVEGLVETARHRLVYAPNGRLENYELRSSGAAQLRQLLTVLTDAASFAALQFPREPVNAGEPWSYSAPYSASSEEGMKIDGRFAIENRLVGTMTLGPKKYAVIEQAITGSAAGRFMVEGAATSVKTQGMGRGVFYFDLETKQIAKVEMTFEQVSSLGEAALGIQTSSRIDITSSTFPDDT